MPRQVAFTAFCQATRAWLASAPSPDPALAAAADVLASNPRLDDRSLYALARDTSDGHTLLGATTLLDLLHLSDW